MLDIFSMNTMGRCLIGAILCLTLYSAAAQQVMNDPGLQPYTPTRIEWLALSLQAQLRQDATVDLPFSLNIINPDHETILIFVRYQPNVDREIMNMAVETAREVTWITARSYGWNSWVKVKERIEMVNPRNVSGRK